MRLTVKVEAPDALADVLASIKLEGRVFCYTEMTSPWSLQLPSNNWAYFHVIERGNGWIKLEDERAVMPLASGDLVIIPHGGGHIIADDLKNTPLSLNEFLSLGTSGKHSLQSENGAETRLVCGKFQFENTLGNPLLALLPPLIHINSYRGRTDEWLELTLKHLAYEARNTRPGSKEMLTRLTGIIFVQAVRAWIEEQPEAQGGWLGALRDPQIGAALSMIHREPSRAWSVTSLANEVGMSRSNFAAKFTKLVGEPPLKYLSNWRMHIAESLLRRERLSVSEVAVRIGYESETSFSKAFKRRFGVSPGTYRRSAFTIKDEEMPSDKPLLINESLIQLPQQHTQ